MTVQLLPYAKPGPKPKLEHSEHLLEQIKALGKIQATVEETASVLRCSERTLQSFFAAHADAKDAHEDGKKEGRASLRRKQFAMAETNATMAIWLGKQYLGQKDMAEITGKDGASLQPIINITIGNERTAHVSSSADPQPPSPPETG